MCTGWIDRVIWEWWLIVVREDKSLLPGTLILSIRLYMFRKWCHSLCCLYSVDSSIQRSMADKELFFLFLFHPLLNFFVLSSIDKWWIYDEDDDSNNSWSSFQSCRHTEFYSSSVFWFPQFTSLQVVEEHSVSQKWNIRISHRPSMCPTLFIVCIIIIITIRGGYYDTR